MPNLEHTETLEQKAIRLARAGRTITSISEELEISWHEARSYLPNGSWQGAMGKVTRRLNKMVSEPDQSKREKLKLEADDYVGFLFDSAKHMRSQVDGARRALSR